MSFYVRSNFKIFLAWLSPKCGMRRKFSFLFQLRVSHLFFYNVKKEIYVFRCINKNSFIKETLKKLKLIFKVLRKNIILSLLESKSDWVVHISPKLMIFLPQCSGCWNCWHGPPCLAGTNILLHVKLWIVTYWFKWKYMCYINLHSGCNVKY